MKKFSENNKRINEILNHDLFLENYHKIEEAEVDRRFCRHNMVHFLDVARIAMILNLQEQYGVEYEMIYAAALLHDIGRYEQYANGTPHEQASAPIATVILRECGFSNAEIEEIAAAIVEHRNPKVVDKDNLEGLLYRADKMSRSCFACAAEAECDWKQNKKNLMLRY
ncbi:MAG: HD domain-containing protein [Lachnospiraceae bacterium]|nr:HD domain-containing protein [Lachnospiraceae bacterium]